jgi:hypothetical protein
LKAELRVPRITTNSLGVSLFASQNETTQDPFAVGGVEATGEAAEAAAQMAEEAFGHVGGAQAA